MIKVYNTLLNARDGMPRMKHAAAAILLLLYLASSTLAGAWGASAALPARLALIAVSTALLAALLFMYRLHLLYAFPIIAAAITFFLSRDITIALTQLILPLPAAILISAVFSLGADKARAVTVASVSFAVSAAILLLVYKLSGGELRSFESIMRSLSEFFASVTTPSRNGPVPAFTEEAASALARYITLSLPAIVFVSVTAAAFASVTLCAALIDLFSFGSFIIPDARVYTPSVVSASLYLISYIVSASLVSIASADIIGFAAENVLLCLLPAMMLYGERSLYKLATKHDRRVLFAVLTVIVLMTSPSMYLMFVSFSGAIALIYKALAPIVRRFMKKLRDDDDDDDDNNDDNRW